MTTPKYTYFETSRSHIYTNFYVKSKSGDIVSFNALVDTGAPFTEISDKSLIRAGFSLSELCRPQIKPLHETQRFGQIHLLEASALSQTVKNWTIHISRFHESWDIDILIGLDFFRKHRVLVDYEIGRITTESFKLI